MWFKSEVSSAMQFIPNELNRPYDLDNRALKKKSEGLKRLQLNSRDNLTIDFYDQFYADHKLLLILFRVLAVMPIERSEPGLITFSWISFSTLYAITFWCLMTFVVVFIGIERIKILHTTDQFDEYIYAVLFVIFLIPHFWTPFVGWGVANEVSIYKSSWGVFQLKFYKVTGIHLQFPRLKTLILIISIACLLVAVLLLQSLSFLLDGFPLWHTAAYYHIITTINMNCALWYINSRAIRVAALSLGECFKKVMASNCSAKTICEYRLLWLNLRELLYMLGNAYARTYCALCIFIFVNIIVAVYGAFSEMFDSGNKFSISYKEIGLIVDVVYCLSLLLILCNCSHSTASEIAKEVQKTLLSVDMKHIDSDSKYEIDFFIVAIELNPAVVSLKGYINVNRELLTSSLATITIYLLVLIQFKFTLDHS